MGYQKQILEYIYAAWQKVVRGFIRVFVIEADGNVSKSEYVIKLSSLDFIAFIIKYL